MDTFTTSSAAAALSASAPLSSHAPQLPSPSPVSPGYPPPPSSSALAAPPSQSTAGPSTTTPSSSLLPALPVGSAPPSASTSTSQSQPSAPRESAFLSPIIPFDPNAASDDDDDDDDGGSPKKKRRGPNAGNGGKSSGAEGSGAGADEKGRRKIEIEYIQKKEKRHITFSKRKAGIMKKAYELATLTGTQVLLLVVSETGIVRQALESKRQICLTDNRNSQVYTFTTTKFQPLVGAGENGQPSEGQRLIQRCLAVSPDDDTSDYISPPADGPLLPLPPSAQKRPFEANSPIHGGQIALRTKQQRPRAKGRPAPIIPPSPTGPASLPTPGIHSTIEGTQQVPPSPHRMHALNPAPMSSPSHSMSDYPPSPGFPPGPSGRQGEGQPGMQSAQDYADMLERASLSGQYGPPSNYPPPPALGYAQQLPNPNRPPHPLDSYPHPRQSSAPVHSSPQSSPRQARQYPPQYQPGAPRSLSRGDEYMRGRRS
ncbi:SPOSA6832_02849, partial [Sporobolomyces salmonicolor]